MWYGGDLVVLEHLGQRRHGDRPSAPHREHEAVAVAERPRRVEDLQRPAAQRNAVLTLRLHPQGRNRPHAAGHVHLVPRRQPHLGGPRCGEHEKLERQFDGGLSGLRRPHRPDGRGHVPVGQRLPVRHDVVLRAEHRQHSVAWVVVPHVEGDGPLQHRPDALPDRAGRLCLAVPDRREDLQHVGRVDLGHRPAADAREGIPFHAPDPVLCVPPPAPAVALLFEHALGGFGEGRNALDAAPVGERIAAQAGQHAVGEGLLAGLGERDERGGAESEFAAPAADDEPLDPASRPGGLDEQVQPVAVGVASGRGGTDEGGRERLVGVPASALGSAGCRGGFGYNIHSTIICGIGLDSAIRPDPLSARRKIINY